MSEDFDDIDWDLADSYDPLSRPPSDRICVWIISARGGFFEFIASSTSRDEDVPENRYGVYEPDGTFRRLGQPVSTASARPDQLDDPEFLRQLGEHLASAPMGVHRLTNSTTVEVKFRKPGFLDKILGARKIEGSWIDRLAQEVERSAANDAAALLCLENDSPSP
ncbi:hypothetical protein KUV57_12690 [Epibacterium sp. DP7N7-1]|nr:hypothetical protein [Epibacterium sp. DP7N7-1]